MPPTLLSHEILNRFEEALRRQRWPGIEQLGAGLTNAEMSQLTARAGLEVPAEARTWWGWHDGLVGDGLRPRGFCGFTFLSLREAVDRTLAMRNSALHALEFDTPAGWGPEYWWCSEWLTVTERDNGTVVACGCGGPPEAPAPIFAIRWAVDDRSKWATPRVGSLGDLVGLWIDALNTGVWTYDAGADQWTRDDERAERDPDVWDLL